MKAKTLRELSTKDLEKKLKELKLDLIKSKAGSGKTTKNTKEIRKTIARIITINNSNKDALKK